MWCICFFKQKTAYEMRISDWSSDVCASSPPRAYVNYTFMPGWTLRGGIARGFKAPTLRQSIADYCMTTGGGSLVRGPLFGNPDPEPEVSKTKAIGLPYDGEGKNGQAACRERGCQVW